MTTLNNNTNNNPNNNNNNNGIPLKISIKARPFKTIVETMLPFGDNFKLIFTNLGMSVSAFNSIFFFF